MSNNNKKEYQISKGAMWLGSLLLFVLGIFAGFASRQFIPLNQTRQQVVTVREKGNQYKFIEPLLTFDVPELDYGAGLKSTKDLIQQSVAEHLRKRNANQISVYVRGLKSGRWIGVNADEKYNPASLLKVPTLIAFFKLAQSNPEILSREALYDGSFDDNQSEYFKPPKPLVAGKSYSIEELLKRMIVYSDNNAARLLHQNIDEKFLLRVYTDLNISAPGPQNDFDFMTAKDYSYFFRILYNATYLDRTFSEKALNLLNETDFGSGIRAGVPNNILVANKFGERTVLSRDHQPVSLELHDCGIVYYPDHPYFLCIMTQGNDFGDLAKAIMDISGIVYQERIRQFTPPLKN